MLKKYKVIDLENDTQLDVRELFRIECNHRSTYFDDIRSAMKHYNECLAKKCDVELWHFEWVFNSKLGKYTATQILLFNNF